MLRIGAHMSVAGGVSKAIDRAELHGCEALQIFSKNANHWRGKPLDPHEIKRFRRRVEETGISPVVSHASYLINLATTSPPLREQSIAAFIDELDRAHALGLLGVVIHPGTCTAGTEDDALRLIADAIRIAFKARPRRKTMVLLEHTAGQGRTLGHRFEHLAAIIDHLDGSPRVGVCLDTCHLVASGYDIVSGEDSPRRSRPSTGWSASIGYECSTPTTRSGRAAAASIATSTSATAASASTRFGGCSRIADSRACRSSSRPRSQPVATNRIRSWEIPLDMKNLDTLRRLRAS